MTGDRWWRLGCINTRIALELEKASLAIGRSLFPSEERKRQAMESTEFEHSPIV